MKRLLFGSLALLLAGCAVSQTREEAPPGARDELAGAVHELEARKAALAGLRRVGDCAEVCRLSELVCVASERICAIARRHEDDPRYARTCASASTDCAAAREQCRSCR